MTIRTVALNSMDVEGCEDFLGKLVSDPNVTRYRIDCVDLGYVSPFGMLVCSHAIKRFRTKHPHCEFELVNHERHTYPAHMGFFRAFGAQFGRAPGEASGSARYIPITILSVDSVREHARNDLIRVQSWLEREAARLAGMLVQGATYEVRRVLSWAITEMLRNIVEHSEAKQLGYCAQYWPSKDMVEVAVLDSGIGVAASLARNPWLEIEDEAHALHLALLPGVSGVAFEGAPMDRHDEWANAGFGLYMASSICREAGSFLIASGDQSLELEGPHKRARRIPIRGTAVRLSVRLSHLAGVDSRRADLIRKGDEVARKLRGTIPGARVASRLVRETGEHPTASGHSHGEPNNPSVTKSDDPSDTHPQ